MGCNLERNDSSLVKSTVMVFSWRDEKTTETTQSRWQVSVKKFQPVRFVIHKEKFQSSRIRATPLGNQILTFQGDE
jgi:hypothetical protein